METDVGRDVRARDARGDDDARQRESDEPLGDVETTDDARRAARGDGRDAGDRDGGDGEWIVERDAGGCARATRGGKETTVGGVRGDVPRRVGDSRG